MKEAAGAANLGVRLPVELLGTLTNIHRAATVCMLAGADCITLRHVAAGTGEYVARVSVKTYFGPRKRKCVSLGSTTSKCKYQSPVARGVRYLNPPPPPPPPPPLPPLPRARAAHPLTHRAATRPSSRSGWWCCAPSWPTPSSAAYGCVGCSRPRVARDERACRDRCRTPVSPRERLALTPTPPRGLHFFCAGVRCRWRSSRPRWTTPTARSPGWPWSGT